MSASRTRVAFQSQERAFITWGQLPPTTVTSRFHTRLLGATDHGLEGGLTWVGRNFYNLGPETEPLAAGHRAKARYVSILSSSVTSPSQASEAVRGQQKMASNAAEVLFV